MATRLDALMPVDPTRRVTRSARQPTRAFGWYADHTAADLADAVAMMDIAEITIYLSVIFPNAFRIDILKTYNELEEYFTKVERHLRLTVFPSSKLVKNDVLDDHGDVSKFVMFDDIDIVC